MSFLVLYPQQVRYIDMDVSNIPNTERTEPTTNDLLRVCVSCHVSPPRKQANVASLVCSAVPSEKFPRQFLHKMAGAFRVSFTPYLSHTKNVLNLIAAYKKQKSLWDFDHEDYKNSLVKEEAWATVATETGIPADICKRKMHSLQSQLRRERCKEREYRKNGRPNWRSKWYAYQAFKFLHARTKTRTNNDGIHPTDQSLVTIIPKIEVDKDQIIGSNNAEPSEYPIENVTITNHSETSDPIDTSATYNATLPQHVSKQTNYGGETSEKLRDEIKVYAETIAHRLSKLKDPKALCITKNKIDNILFAAEMEIYEQEQTNVDYYKLSPTESYHYSESNQ